MTELDLDAIESRANAGVRQTTADTDVLALVARVRELEQQIAKVREVLDAEEAAVTAAAIDYGAMLPRIVEIDDILTALEDPS